MKGKKFLLAGVAILGLGMTSCNNDDVPSVGNPTEGSTFVGMYISTMKDVMTRAVNAAREITRVEQRRARLSLYGLSLLVRLGTGR